jgi:UDP-N-acetylglucosamine--N-acetylmuramyl-(pentapeptide) pyrophosphoryl-undecaprenol N-acetylglucosamine transferase
MKIIIVGGHLSPALAVIERLPRDTEILFIGRKYALEGDKAFSLEYQKITSLGIRFESLTTGRLQRKFTRFTLYSLFKLPIGLLQALKILSNFKPDVLVCFGGYVQVPVAAAAYILHIPVITHEQTRKAGLANKLITPFAKTICISWPESAAYFPKAKTILTGLPLRKEFFQKPAASKDPNRKIIYITGGSLGAHAINVLVEGILHKLLESFYLIHQTGGATEYNDYERLGKIKDGLPKDLRDKYKLVKFIDPKETPGIMDSADLVISRSGMNTVTELMYLEKPCLLIPLPHGQSQEQLKNAVFAEKYGNARVLHQEELTPEILYSQITEFIAKLDNAGIKTPQTKKKINYDAAEKIAQIIVQAYRQKSSSKK